jgi:TonB family protein
MKTSISPTSILTRAGYASSIALLLTLAGCASGPLRQQTSELALLHSVDLQPGDTAPFAVSTVTPAYPERLILAGVEGSAWVRCWIDQTGGIHHVTAHEASLPEFGDAAIAAVKKWSFAPGTRNGQPMGAWVGIPFNFVPTFSSETSLRRW